MIYRCDTTPCSQPHRWPDHNQESHNLNCKKIYKRIPTEVFTGPWGFRTLKLPEFIGNQHMKMVSLSAVYIGRLYPQQTPLVLISVRGWFDPTATVRLEELSQRKTGNWTRDVTACSAVFQPTASPRAPSRNCKTIQFTKLKLYCCYYIHLHII